MELAKILAITPITQQGVGVVTIGLGIAGIISAIANAIFSKNDLEKKKAISEFKEKIVFVQMGLLTIIPVVSSIYWIVMETKHDLRLLAFSLPISQQLSGLFLLGLGIAIAVAEVAHEIFANKNVNILELDLKEIKEFIKVGAITIIPIISTIYWLSKKEEGFK